MYQFPACCSLLVALSACSVQAQSSLFDIETIRDSSTLDVEILQDWHVDSIDGSTRQKLIEITVAHWWEGVTYRVPVRIIIPLEGVADGFVITGGAHWDELMSDEPVNEGSTSAIALAQGAGSVFTVIQPLAAMPGGEALQDECYSRWTDTGDGRYTDIWIWSMTHMRAVTAVLQEDLVQQGRILGYGTSKNGGTPAIALMHDDRYTGLVAEAASAYYSPLDRRDPAVVEENEAANDWFFAALDAGEIDPGDHTRNFYYNSVYENPLIVYVNLLTAAGWSDEEVQAAAATLWGQCALSAAIDVVQARDAEVLFESGTHDWVADDLAWGGANHPEISHFLLINGGHGQNADPLLVTGASRNTRHNFIERHLGAPHDLLEAPEASYEIVDGILQVTVVFTEGPQPDEGRVVWMDDRHPGGSAPYLWREYGLENVEDLTWNSKTGAWTAQVQLPEGIETLDVFTDHHKFIETAGRDSWISSPYTRVDLGGSKAIPGDLDGDGAVTGGDLTILLGAWGRCPPELECIGELTGDDTVDGADLTVLLGNWGQGG